MVSGCERTGKGGGVGVDGCGDLIGRNSNRRYKIQKKIDENTKRNTVLKFRETTQNTFFRIFVFFPVSRND